MHSPRDYPKICGDNPPDAPGDAAKALAPGAHVVGDRLAFRLEDSAAAFEGVQLWNDLHLPDTAFAREDGGWNLTLPRPAVDRLEYLYAVRAARPDAGDDAPTEHLLDPANPRRVGGAFGDHSWLPMPGYREPSWLTAEPVPGRTRISHVCDTPVGNVEIHLWEPESLFTGDPPLHAPLLLVHDGPEMAELAGLLHYAGAMIATKRLPAMRVALLAPGARDERYAVNDDYASALAEHIVPHLQAIAPSNVRPAIMGASLGALAALHAHWRHPGVFGALHLASGSFFTPALDPQESGYARWSEVTGFVDEVSDDGPPARAGSKTPVIGMVCGSAEENLANNLYMRDVLRGQGFRVTWGTVRDTHCYTCWRDLLDPQLTELLAGLWAPSRAGR